MAFGKNPDQLAKVTPFGGNYRQRVARATRNNRPKQQRAFRRFNEEFKPNEFRPDHIRLIPGMYKVELVDDSGEVYIDELPWWQYVDHFHGPLKKSCICSAGPMRFSRQHAQPCHGCSLYWEDYNARKSLPKNQKGPNRISMRQMYVYTVLDYGVYHKIERTDASGNLILSKKTQQPYFDWVKCAQVGCQGCQMGKESKQGHVMPWPMGRSHFETLDGYAEYVGNSCASCGGRDCIQSVSWSCANPECQALIVDLATTHLTQDQLNEMIKEPVVCHACNARTYLQENYSCNSCSSPMRASIFDVDLEVRRKKSAEGKGTQLVVPRTGDPTPIDPQFAEIAKPLPLEKLYAPDSLEYQARQFGVQDNGAQQNYTSY